MLLPPPISTRTDTRFPYPTRFRSGGWGTGLLTECLAPIRAGGCDGAVAGILDGPAPARSLRDRTLVTRRSCRERRRRADRAPEGDHRGTRGPGRRPLPAAPAPRGRSGAPAHRGRRRLLARRRSPTPPGQGAAPPGEARQARSEEHTSELQAL